MGFVKPGETEEQSNNALTFEKHMQESVGAEYPLEDIFANLETKEIAEEVERYVRYRIEWSRR